MRLVMVFLGLGNHTQNTICGSQKEFFRAVPRNATAGCPAAAPAVQSIIFTYHFLFIYLSWLIFCFPLGTTFECDENEFSCDDNVCWPRSVKCDKRADCRDGTDELDCPES